MERGAPSAALRVGELLFDAIDSLQQMPERGRMSSRPGSRELVVPFGAAAYVFLYKITADAVIIARIQLAGNGGRIVPHSASTTRPVILPSRSS